MAHLELAVPNDKQALEQARQSVLTFIEPHRLSPREVYKLELVLEEALMNRLWHAFPDGKVHSTNIVLHLRPRAIEITFDDDGVPFNPLDHAPAAPATSLQEAAPGGLGLALTRRAASQCAYEYVEGRNRFTVVLDRA